MANGMSSLLVGASGLQSAQTALNTTAHNLSNINTVGYTRQQILFTDNRYLNVNTLSGKEKLGLGVTVAEINRIRNDFIDAAYRKENSRLGYVDSQYNALQEVESLFGETQGVTYQSFLTNLYDAMNEVKNNPSSTVARSSLIQYATAFLDQSNAIFTGLNQYRSTLNTQVNNMVNKINSLGNTIYSLNDQIIKVESGGQEKANDLRDRRDKALDELSKYISINYYEDNDGYIKISSDGAPFVYPGGVNEMSTRVSEGNGLLVPTWSALGKDVYATDELGTGDANNDRGALKGLLLARGLDDVDYTDVPVKPDTKNYDLTTEAGRQQYTKDYDAYTSKQQYYNTYIEPSLMLSSIVGLDKLVNGIVTSINDILCPEKQITTTTALTNTSGDELKAKAYNYVSTESKLYKRDGTEVHGEAQPDGSYHYKSSEILYSNTTGTTKAPVTSYEYSLLDTDNTGYGMDADKTVGQELFSRKDTDRYIKTTDHTGKTIYVRNDTDTAGLFSDYKLGNLEMNSVVTQNIAKIPLSTIKGEEDMDRAKQFISMWEKDFDSVNPEQYANGNFNTFYSNFIGEFATVGGRLHDLVSNETKMVDGYNNQRLQTSGVSSDEELTKMIKFQQAYNAASRYVNVVSEMMEHLVTSLGR